MTDASENPAADLTHALKRAKLEALQQAIRLQRAKEDFGAFCRFMKPDPNKPDDPDATTFVMNPLVRLLVDTLPRIERGEILRLAISAPPQHGKSETGTRLFASWYMGRRPWRNLMLGTYNQDFANDFGGQIRDIIQSDRYRQVFSDCTLQRGSQSKSEMVTDQGGRMVFLGRGGSGTGRPADLFLIDDPLKDAEEADSDTIRKQLWEWFTKVAYTRCHAASAIVIIHTRWHEDDLIGRLCDPDHPDHDPEIAKDWTYLNIPALLTAREKPLADALGIELNTDGEAALWPERFPLSHLKTAQRLNRVGFSALYQGRPAPEDGAYFTRDMLVGYKSPAELPKRLRLYGASDHAVTEKEENDPVCMGCVGVDENDDIWVLPDLVWEHLETDESVEAMLDLMVRHKPMIWWAENDVIGKAIGPFLRKRMTERKVYTYIDPQTPSKSKKARARSIQGRMQMRKVHFPVFAKWWTAAENQLLKFPNATHDDFVDWLAWIGRGLDVELAAPRERQAEDNVIRVGSIAWVKARTLVEERDRKIRQAGGF